VYDDTSAEIRKYIAEAIERYEKNPTADDHESGVLEKLVKIDKNIGKTMAEDMLFAGIDTTSSAVVSVMYCLAKNPDKQEILQQEVMQILPEKSSKLNATSFNSVPYLRAVIKESLRLKPVVNGNMRRTTEEIVLQGYRIPKDVNFDASCYDSI
jgi:cytochrome P450 family 12